MHFDYLSILSFSITYSFIRKFAFKIKVHNLLNYYLIQATVQYEAFQDTKNLYRRENWYILLLESAFKDYGAYDFYKMI